MLLERRAVAQLTPAIVTPTVRDPPGAESATVPSTERTDGTEAEPSSHGAGERTADRGRISELTVTVRSPAVPAASRRHAAAMERTRRDLRERQVGRDEQRRPAAADRRPQSGARFRRHRPKLAAVVVPPAVGRPARRQTAHMPVADAEDGEGESPRHRDGRRAARLPVAGPRAGGADSELPGGIVSPAVRRARGSEAAREEIPRTDAREGEA